MSSPIHLQPPKKEPSQESKQCFVSIYGGVFYEKPFQHTVSAQILSATNKQAKPFASYYYYPLAKHYPTTKLAVVYCGFTQIARAFM